jgi:hypothetical protein
MSDSYEIARFLDNLRQRGFDITRLGPRAGYLVNRQNNGAPRSAQLLMLNSTLFDAYFDAAYATWTLPPGSIDRGEEILSLMAVEAEAALTSLDAAGRTQVTELGLRRDESGSVEWYRIKDQELASADAG